MNDNTSQVRKRQAPGGSVVGNGGGDEGVPASAKVPLSPLGAARGTDGYSSGAEACC